MKILIISLSGAGDILMTLPLLNELRKAYPTWKIDYLVMQGEISRDIIKNNTEIDKVIYFNFMKEGALKSVLFCRKLKKEKYDISITSYPQARVHYSVISRLINAKKRIGFSYQSHGLDMNSLFFTDLIKEDFSSHVVENNLRVLEVLGIKRKIKIPRLTFKLDKKDIEFAKLFFKKNKINKSVVIHPGSGTTKNFILKRWPKERFSELCREIYKKTKAKIILAGGKDEKELKEEIIKKSGLKENKEIFNLEAEIGKIAAIIKKSKLVIANDTILGHIAAAVGTRIIGIFGPTSWENTAPFTKKREIICKRPKEIKPYIHGSKGINKEQAAGLLKIGVDDVFKIAKKFL